MSARAQGQERRPPQSRQRLRTIALGLSAAVIALYLALPPLSTLGAVRRQAERAMSAAAGREVRIAQLRLGYDLALRLSRISISQPSAAPFFVVERVALYISVPGLLTRHPFTVKLSAPRIFIEHLPPSGQSSAPPALPFRSVEIEDGYVVKGKDGDAIGPITVSVEAIRTGQQTQASLVIDSRLPPLDVTANVSVADRELTVSAFQLKWENVPLAILADRFTTASHEASVEGSLEVTAQAAGPINELSGSGRVRVRRLRYRTGAVEIAGDIDAPMELHGNRLDLAPPGLSLLAPNFTIVGLTGSAAQVGLEGTLTRDGQVLNGKGTISLTQVEAHDEAFARVIERITGTAMVAGSWSPTEPLALRVELSAATGELLWDRIYADISRHPVELGVDIRQAAQGMSLSNIEAQAMGLGAVTGDATLRWVPSVEKMNVQIEVADLGALYALAVRDPLKESYPFLANTTATGAVKARATVRRQRSGFSLIGHLHLGNVGFSAPDPVLEVQGLSAELPLRLGAIADTGGPQEGAVRAISLRFGNVVTHDIAATVEVRPNTVDLREPVTVPLLGGAVQLTQFAAKDLTSTQPRASLGMNVKSIGLEGLTKTLGLPLLRGTISGAIPNITAIGGGIRSEGEIRIEALDGIIALRNLSIEQIFSSVPALGFDLDFHDISLGRLSDAMEVGRISGVARGEARNVRIVNGQPSRFDAWMETVERPGVPQRISVSAIRQLSILGGSGGDPLTQGVLSFFDEYRYAKMGFKCSLKNDRFLLRGVETLDGKEHLVVGSFLPPRVNVVSHSQVISFSEMVRRLQRMTTASASEEPGGEEK